MYGQESTNSIGYGSKGSSVGYSEPQRTPEMQRYTDQLAKAIESLGQGFNVLEDRLGPITGPHPPETKNASGQLIAAASTNYGQLLSNAVQMIEVLDARVRGVLARLEV